ncbi:hypothetical protein Hypma_004520 [Hypsizygus marmoreus]|uniref:Uncharacterized protein n=1 Tax=Hypsizygus marmoreus TaxID=39966 RepID=A0A369K6F2_HYPMA|nr:hypothetical protein Hypma_004520 [Hypsizygus marmoreus]
MTVASIQVLVELRKWREVFTDSDIWYFLITWCYILRMRFATRPAQNRSSLVAFLCLRITLCITDAVGAPSDPQRPSKSLSCAEHLIFMLPTRYVTAPSSPPFSRPPPSASSPSLGAVSPMIDYELPFDARLLHFILVVRRLGSTPDPWFNGPLVFIEIERVGMTFLAGIICLAMYIYVFRDPGTGVRVGTNVCGMQCLSGGCVQNPCAIAVQGPAACWALSWWLSGFCFEVF